MQSKRVSAVSGAGSAARDGFSRCGSELREARERLGWDLGEVAAALRIKLAYLSAIEDGRLSALPGNAYALGFLRSYATALGLDADDLTRRFRIESADINRRPDLAFPSPVPERGVPTSAAILVGLVVVVIAYAAWYRLSDHETTPVHSVPPVPAQLLSNHRAAAISPQVASVMPTNAAPPTASGAAGGGPARSGGAAPPIGADTVGAAVPQAATPTASASSNSSAASPQARPAPVPTAPGPVATPPAATPSATGATVTPSGSPLPAATTAPSTPPGTTASGIVLVASAPSWIEVRTADGKVLTDHVLQNGETWQAPPGVAGLLLTTGNAGGLAISRNGTRGPLLGAAGAVLRRVPLDAGAAATVPAAVAVVPTAATTTPPPGGTPSGLTAPKRVTPSRRPAAPSDDESADQLNARELGDKAPLRH